MTIEGISVLVPTYGRTQLLCEVIECYLRQDWGGPSELIIYNDLGVQTLHLDAPVPLNKSIQIFNTPLREPTLGDKRNTLLAMAKYPIVTYWDDDDIYLPHRLSLGFVLLHDYSGEKIKIREASREYKEWRLLENGLMVLRYARPFGTMTARKSAILEVGGFPSLERLQDVAMVNKMITAHKLPNLPQVDWLPSTIYRLHSTLQGGHVTNAPNTVSADPHSPVHNESVRQHIISSTAARIQLGEEPSGAVHLTPHWKMDYLKKAEEAWATQNPRLRSEQ